MQRVVGDVAQDDRRFAGGRDRERTVAGRMAWSRQEAYFGRDRCLTVDELELRRIAQR